MPEREDTGRPPSRLRQLLAVQTSHPPVLDRRSGGANPAFIAPFGSGASAGPILLSANLERHPATAFAPSVPIFRLRAQLLTTPRSARSDPSGAAQCVAHGHGSQRPPSRTRAPSLPATSSRALEGFLTMRPPRLSFTRLWATSDRERLPASSVSCNSAHRTRRRRGGQNDAAARGKDSALGKSARAALCTHHDPRRSRRCAPGRARTGPGWRSNLLGGFFRGKRDQRSSGRCRLRAPPTSASQGAVQQRCPEGASPVRAARPRRGGHRRSRHGAASGPRARGRDAHTCCVMKYSRGDARLGFAQRAIQFPAVSHQHDHALSGRQRPHRAAQAKAAAAPGGARRPHHAAAVCASATPLAHCRRHPDTRTVLGSTAPATPAASVRRDLTGDNGLLT